MNDTDRLSAEFGAAWVALSCALDPDLAPALSYRERLALVALANQELSLTLDRLCDGERKLH